MGDSIKSIVDSIRKHSNFKRLAVYSIQSLCKKCTPPSNGWQQNATEAFECGATEAIAEVVAKNPGDAELFLQSLVQLQACAVAGSAAGLLINGSLATIVKAFGTYFDQAKAPTASDAVRDGLIVGSVYKAAGGAAEAVAVTESFMRLLAYVALQARGEAASPSAGIIPCLLGLLLRLPTPSSVRLALVALESLGRTSAGVTALTAPQAITTVLTAASQLFGVDASAATETPTAGGAMSRLARVQAASTGRATLSPTAGGGAGGRSRSSLAQINGHLDPAFKLLDRISRDDGGLKALRESQAVSALALAVEWAQSAASPVGSGGMGSSRVAQGIDPSVGATGVRLLARVLGNDLAALISRVSAAASGGNRSEGDFASSLLSSLATDPEVAGRLVNNLTTLTAMVDLLAINNGACISSKAAAALCSAIRRVAAHSLEFGDALVGVGAVGRLVTTARTMASAGPQGAIALTEAMTALADVITTPEDVAVADSNGTGAAFFLGLLSDRGAADPSCAAACLAVLHAFQCNGYDQANLAAAGLVKLTLAAMTSDAPGANCHMELQVVGSAVLAACAMGAQRDGRRDEEAVGAVVQAGALLVAINNLDLAIHAVPGPTSGNPGSFTTGTATRLLSTSASYIGRPSIAVAGVKAAQRLSLHAASQPQDSSTVGEMEGEAAASAALAGSHPAAPTLAAVSMHLCAILCGSSGTEATKTAKAQGMVRAMLMAYGRHGDSDAVHDAFTDLVEGTIGEEELGSSVLAIARDTALLRDIMASVDPALISIAEADLGKEGLIATSAQGEVSISAADPDDASGAHEGGSKPSSAPVKGKGGAKEIPGTVAARIAEALCLLQASTCSARLSGILANAQGIPVLVRVLGIVSVVKAKADPHRGGAKGGRGKAVVLQTGGGRGAAVDPEAERTIPESVQNEILVRCCSTLTGLARIAIDWRVGTLGLDPVPTSISNAQGLVGGTTGVGSPTAGRGKATGVSAAGHRRQRSGKTVGDVLAATQSTIARGLYRPVVTRILVKTINGRVNLPGTLSAASVCLGVLSLGKVGGGSAGAGEGSAVLDTMIGQGGVEALVGGLRAHPALLPALQAVSNSLACIAIIGRGLDESRGTLKMPAPPETFGSAAVATRGATREIIRALQNASAAANGSGARWYGTAGQAALCSLLRVLLVIAETPKGAEILRKQGTVDALISTLDSGSAAAEGGAEGEEKEGSGKAAPGGGAADANSGFSVASALSGDVFGGALAAVTDAGAGAGRGGGGGAVAGGDPSSSIMGGQGPEASELILGILSKLMDSKDLAEAVKTVNSSADKVSSGTLKMAAIQLTKLALTTIYSLAGKDNGIKAGGALWTEALTAIVRLVSAFTGSADGILGKSGQIDAGKLEVACRSAQVLLPAISNTLAAIVAFRPKLDLTLAGNEGVEGAADLPGRWSAQVGSACTTLLACAELATGVRTPSGKASPASAKGAVDRLATAFRTGLFESLVAVNSLLQRDGAAGDAVLANAVPVVGGLIRSTGRLVDDGDADGLACALDVLYSIAKVHTAKGEDGITAILSCQPPLQPILVRSLSELVSSNTPTSATGTGCALLLLARMAHKQTDMAAALREASISDSVRQALQRFCAPPAPEEAAAAATTEGGAQARDVEGIGAARVLEGVALLQAQLFGYAGSAGAAAQENDMSILSRVLGIVREEPGGAYLSQAPKAMTAVCEVVASACTQTEAGGRVIGEDAAVAARDMCTGMDARGLIVAAMSSARADARLLKAGARALTALGGGSGSGAALETRRAAAYVRRAAGVRPITGLLPEGDPAYTAPEASATSPTGLGAGVGGGTPAMSPTLTSPMGSGQGKAADKGAAEAMNGLETCVRNLSAALAGENSLTPASFRYAFDTLVAAIGTAVAAHSAVKEGRLTVTPAPQKADKPHHHHSGSTGSNAMSSRASMRMSLAVGGVEGGTPGVSGRGNRMSLAPGRHTSTDSSVRASPDKEAQGASMMTQEAAQASFLAQCSSVLATAVQGLVRLGTPTLVPNPSPADNSGQASTRPDLAAALGLPQVTTVWDATAEEVGRLGEPRGTASHHATAIAHEAAAAQAGKAGMPWPAATTAGCPIAASVSAGELIDGLLLALGFENSTPQSTTRSPSSAPSPASTSPFRVAGYTVSSTVAESLQKAVEELVALADKKEGSLLGPSAAPASPRQTPSGSALACAELVWASSARGLMHVLATALMVGQPSTDSLVVPVSTPTANTVQSSMQLDAGCIASLRACLSSVVGCASNPGVARVLAMAATGGLVTPTAAKTPGGSVNKGSAGFPTATAAGSVPATPVSILLQLMISAEALTRPENGELVRRMREYMDGKAQDADEFNAAQDFLRHVCPGDSLRSLVSAVCTPPGLSLDASPAWLLLSQVMDPQESGGLTRLTPTGETEELAAPVRAGSLSCMRIVSEILSCMVEAAGGSTAPSTGGEGVTLNSNDAVVLKGGLGQAASLLAAWAAASVITIETDEPQPSLGTSLTSPVARRSASAMSMPPSLQHLTSRLPGQRPAITPLDHVAEESGEHEEGVPEAKSAPAVVAARRSIRSARGASKSGNVSFAIPTPMPGTNSDTTAATDLYIASAHAVTFSAIRALSYMDLARTGKVTSVPSLVGGTSVPGGDPSPLGSTPPAIASPSAVVTPSGATATELPALLADEACMSLYRSALRQPGGDLLATGGVQVLRRTLGLAPSNTVSTMTQETLAQVEALAVGGVFARVCLALGLHSSSHAYAREVIRLLDDLGRALAAHASHPEGKYSGQLLKGSMGLTGGCLKALQGTVKRLGRDEGDEVIVTIGERLVACLSDVFSSVSGKGFLDKMEKAVTALEACPIVKVTRRDGSVVYATRPSTTPGSPTSFDVDSVAGEEAMPEGFIKMMADLEALQKVSANLEPEAVPVVPGPLLGRVSAGLQTHILDPRVAGIMAWALARACENPGNHQEMVGSTAAIDALVSVTRWHKGDSFVAEAVASGFRPLTISLQVVQVLKRKGAVPALVDITKAHTNTMLPRRVSYEEVSMDGQGGQAKEARARAHKVLMKKLMSPQGAIGGPNMTDGTGVEGGSEEEEQTQTAPVKPEDMEPRIAHYAVQCLANVACDNVVEDPSTIPNYIAVQQHVDKGCSGGVARLVAAGGIDALIEVMKAHLERPRVLEDALCALSNVAYSCDGVRLLIGRTAAALVVSVLRVFNGDPRTFSMALRTVGNLTRCDENIVSVVAAGVIDGITEGMARNGGNAEVLKLAADVINNLASIDESVIDREKGLKQLRAGLAAREKAMTGVNSPRVRTPAPVKKSPLTSLPGMPTPGGSNAAAPATTASPAAPAEASAGTTTTTTPETAPNPAAGVGGRASRAERVAKMTSLQDAVATLLLDDGAHTALRTAMITHVTDAAVISACLRSLEYMVETRDLVDRVEVEAELGKAVCQVMRSCDFDPELTVKGARVLSQMLRHEDSPARAGALSAGAAHVLLSAVETHRLNVDVFTTVLKVLLSTVSTDTAVLTAAKELDAPATLLTILSEAGKALSGHKSGSASGPGTVQGGGAPGGQAGNATMAQQTINTLATITTEKALVVVRQVLLLLGNWASSDASLAGKMSSQASRSITTVLAPPTPAKANEGPTTPYQDGPLLEAALAVLAPIAMSSPATAESLACDGDCLRLVSPLTCFGPLMDRQALVNSTLDLLTACGKASPAAALAVLEANGHGVAQGLAVHWALKRTVEEGVRRGMYERCGVVVVTAQDTALPARREKAVSAAREAAAAAAEGAAPTGPGSARDLTATVDLRSSRPEVAALSPRSRHKDDQHFITAVEARVKEAEKIAVKRGISTAAVLEERAGVIPWSLLSIPTTTIDRMAGGAMDGSGRPTDLPCDVWFLPGMAPAGVQPKQKARKMRLTLSEDLRVLTWAYTSRRVNKVIDWNLPLSSVLDVRPGVPAIPSTDRLKKPVLALRNPNIGRGIVLESDTSALLHLEAGNAEEHDRLLRTFSLLVQYARAREGLMQPLPDITQEQPMAMDATGMGMAPPALSIPPPAAGSAVVDYVGEGVVSQHQAQSQAGQEVGEVQKPVEAPAGGAPAGSPPAPQA